MKSCFTVFCILMFFVTSTSVAQLPWTKDANNPIMSGGTGTWNTHVFMPSILYNSDSSRYEMWFGASDGGSNWYPYRIGFATSINGVNWDMHSTAVLTPNSGTWDETTVEGPMVIRENGTYKMWYTGWSPSDDTGKIGYATSQDGIQWTKDTVNNPVFGPGTATWEAGGPHYCCVMPVPGGGYKMWYTGFDAGYTIGYIGYATSGNGIDWVRAPDSLNPVLTKGSNGQWDDQYVSSNHTMSIDGTYYMWYSGNKSGQSFSQIGFAISMDGIHWTKYDDTNTTSTLYADSDPVLKTSQGQWDGNMVEQPSVMLIGDSLHMWYGGVRNPHSTYRWRIGHATSPLTFINVPNQYATIQGAINVATDGDVVLVADGTYQENINFKGKAITVASHFYVDGDTSHISNTIIDGSNPSNPDSGSVVTFNSGEDTTSVLMGFTITGGTGKRYIDPWGTTFRQGAGVDVLLSGAKIVSNKIVNNHIPSNIGYQAFGAGICVFGMADENVAIYDNEISNNTITSMSHTYGAGVSMGTSGSIRFIRNSVYQNSNTASGTRVALGGGLYVWGGIWQGVSFNGDIIISRNIIKGNTLTPGTGTVLPQGGGSIYIDLCSPKIENNIIVDNHAPNGAGVLVCAKPRGGLTGNSEPVFINNTIANNVAQFYGGGIYSFGDPNNAVHTKIMNTIIWGNSGTLGPNLRNIGPISVVYSDIQGGFTGTGNINTDPLFADSILFDLTQNSHCVGTGIDSIQIGGIWYYAPPFDYDGDPRPNPIDELVDIGAEESYFPNSIIKKDSDQLPITFSLKQNYPNPFNPSTTIEFAIPKTEFVTLKIYNLLGQEVATLVSDKLTPGEYKYTWDASQLASGVYYYKLEASEFTQTRKLILMK